MAQKIVKNQIWRNKKNNSKSVVIVSLGSNGGENIMVQDLKGSNKAYEMPVETLYKDYQNTQQTLQEYRLKNKIRGM